MEGSIKEKSREATPEPKHEPTPSPEWNGSLEYQSASWFPYLYQATNGKKIRNEIDFLNAMIKLVKILTDEGIFQDLMRSLMDMYRDDILESMHIEKLNSAVS